jgi:hypothetical protein
MQATFVTDYSYASCMCLSAVSICLSALSLCTIPAHIPLYLYPFLNTVSKQRPFEYLRLTSLGVIGALVKVSHSHSLVSH